MSKRQAALFAAVVLPVLGVTTYIMALAGSPQHLWVLGLFGAAP